MINNNELPNHLSFDNDFTKERYQNLLGFHTKSIIMYDRNDD